MTRDSQRLVQYCFLRVGDGDAAGDYDGDADDDDGDDNSDEGGIGDNDRDDEYAIRARCWPTLRQPR